MTQKKRISNKVKSLAHVKAQEPNLEAQDEPGREERFIRNLALYPTVQEAGIASGYSESYCSSTLYLKLKSPKFQQKLRDFYIANSHLNLPKIANIHSQIIDHLTKNPLEAPKFGRTLKMELQTSRVLDSDTPSVQIVNVSSIQNLMLEFQEHRENPQAEVIEAETVTPEDKES